MQSEKLCRNVTICVCYPFLFQFFFYSSVARSAVAYGVCLLRIYHIRNMPYFSCATQLWACACVHACVLTPNVWRHKLRLNLPHICWGVSNRFFEKFNNRWNSRKQRVCMRVQCTQQYTIVPTGFRRHRRRRRRHHLFWVKRPKFDSKNMTKSVIEIVWHEFLVSVTYVTESRLLTQNCHSISLGFVIIIYYAMFYLSIITQHRNEYSIGWIIRSNNDNQFENYTVKSTRKASVLANLLIEM